MDGPDVRDAEVDVRPPGPAGPRARLLLTNDDGIGSPGLQLLARTLAEHHEVVVVAPSRDVSGAGTSMGPLDAADPTRLDRQDLDGIEAYGIDGPPGLAVLAAALGAFGDPPDVVVSGPNAGLNTGTSIIHSGTVGAALTGRTFGSRAVAFSVAPGDRWFWEAAAAVAPSIVGWALAQQDPVTLNVNVPAVPPEEIRGARWADIDAFGHFEVATQADDGTVLSLGVRDRRSGVAPDSDTALCLDGYVTLTLLSQLTAEPAPDIDPDDLVAPRRAHADRRGVRPNPRVGADSIRSAAGYCAQPHDLAHLPRPSHLGPGATRGVRRAVAARATRDQRRGRGDRRARRVGVDGVPRGLRVAQPHIEVVLVLDVADGLVHGVEAVRNPDKLVHILPPSGSA